MKQEKHAKHKYVHDNKYKIKIIRTLAIIFILFALVLLFVAFKIPFTYGNVNKPENNEIIETPVTEEPEQIEPEQFEIVDTSDLPQKYQGHTVLGKIVIEKLGVTQKILEDTTNESLNLGVTKFWGPDLNEPRQLKPCRA